MGTRLAAQIVAVFQGDLLAARARRDGVKVHVPDDWSYWPYLLKSQKPPDPSVLRELIKGPENLNYTKKLLKLTMLKKALKLLKFKKQGAQIDGLKIKLITPSVLKNSIIATQRTQLIVEHALKAKKDVVFCRSNKWFKEVKTVELEQSMERNDKELEDKIFEMLKNGYQKYGIELPDHSQKIYSKFHDKRCCCFACALRKIIKNSRKFTT